MSAINWNSVVKAAARQHARATRQAVTVIDKRRFSFEFDSYFGHYRVTECSTGEEIARFNTRKITEAKRWLREWLAN